MSKVASPSSAARPPVLAAPCAAAAPDAAALRTGAAFQRFCAKCNVTKPAAKRCSGCHGVRFCDSVCQRAEWAAHRALCQQPTRADQIGLPPLHRAILEGKKHLFEPDFLAKHQNVRDSYNGTVEDLQAMMAPLPPDDETDTGWEFEDEDKVIKPLSRRKYFEITAMHYLDGFHGSGDTIVYQHQNPQKKYDTLILASDDPRVQTFDPKKAPKTFLKKFDEKIGFGVCSKDVIQEDAIVCLGAGKLVRDALNTPKAARYNIIRAIDATEIAGKGTLINDGAPNCRIALIQNYKGLQYVPVIVALRKILPGEELRVSYAGTVEGQWGNADKGAHSVKLGRYTMTPEATRELQQFCETDYVDVLGSEMFTKALPLAFQGINRVPSVAASLKPLMDLAARMGQPLAKPSTQHQRALLYYFINTPYAFIKMHLMRSANLDNTRAALGFLEPQMALPSSINYRKILDAIEKILELESKGDKKIVREVLKCLDETSMMSMALMLERMFKDPDLSHRRVRQYRTLSLMLEDIIKLALPKGIDLIFSPSEKKEGGELDIASLKKQFHTLPDKLQKEFMNQLTGCIEGSKAEGLAKEAIMLLKLDWELRK